MCTTNELAGRIQGVADLLCCLATELDKRGIIDALQFADQARGLAERRVGENQEVVNVAKQTLADLADLIAGEYWSRRSEGPRPKS